MASPKTKNPYSKVDLKALKSKITSFMMYLSDTKIDGDLEDKVAFKQTANGGIVKVITDKIESIITSQITVVEKCAKILESIFEREGLTDFTNDTIVTLVSKLEEIEKYDDERPPHTREDRMVVISTARSSMEVVAATKDDQVKQMAVIMEKVFKVKPLIAELNEKREEARLRNGMRKPAFMEL